MLARALRWAFLFAALSAAAIGAPEPGLFQVAMPPQIQRILQKAQSGQPLTKEEQQALTDWGKSMAAAATSGTGQSGAARGTAQGGAGQGAASNDAARQSGSRAERGRAAARPSAGSISLPKLYGSVSLSWGARDKRTERKQFGGGYRETTWDYDGELEVSADLDGGLGDFGGESYAKGTARASKYRETMTRTMRDFQSGVEVSKHVTVETLEIDGQAAPVILPGRGRDGSDCWARFEPASKAMRLMLKILVPMRMSYTQDGEEAPSRPLPPLPVLIGTRLEAKAPPPPKAVRAGAGKKADDTISAKGKWSGKTVGPWGWVGLSAPLYQPYGSDVLPAAPKDAVLPFGMDPALDSIGSGMGGPWAGKLDLKWDLSSTDKVKAVPRAEPLQALRGETVQLDGSDSEGRRLSYEWSFSASGCPKEISADGNARKQGAKVSFKPLCPTEVTLTVRNQISQDRKSIRVEVKPRPFRTDSSTSPEGILIPCADDQGQDKPILPHGQGKFDQLVGWVGGRNVCGLDGDACVPDHALHPLPTGSASKRSSDEETCSSQSCEGKTWNDVGYELEPVEDPDGPFDGVWYVSKYKLQVNRQVLINRYIRENGEHMQHSAGKPIGKTFYEANKDLNADVDGYLAAIRKHEAHHTQVIEDQLKANDPGEDIEKMGSRDGSDALQKDVDKAICAAEKAILGAGCAVDRGPPGWGPKSLYVLDIATGDWVKTGGWKVQK